MISKERNSGNRIICKQFVSRNLLSSCAVKLFKFCLIMLPALLERPSVRRKQTSYNPRLNLNSMYTCSHFWLTPFVACNAAFLLLHSCLHRVRARICYCLQLCTNASAKIRCLVLRYLPVDSWL